ncbi:MAG: LPS-assembly protein LptD [bacterium]|nr:LPS-assembly protein LptD [bacterium]
MNRTPRQTRSSRSRFPCLLLPAVIALGVLGGALAADRPAAAADRRFSRLRADRVVERIVDGERITYLYGNAFIDRDTVTAAADTGVVYRDRERYELYGHVRLTNLGTILTCRRAIYLRLLGSGDFYDDVRVVEDEVVGTGRMGKSRRAGRDLHLMGNALLVTPEYSVRADTIYRDRLTGVGEAFGHVRIMEPGAENLVTGDHAVFLADEDVAEVDRNPVLTSRGQTNGPLVSTAGLMRFFRAEDRVVMIDSVRIRQAQMFAKADTAVALGRERLLLTGNPEVEQGASSVMRGEEIEFFYRNGLLHRVILTGQAIMEDSAPDSLSGIYRGLPGHDVLEGDSISIEFEEGQIRRSVVVGNARSRYTPLDLEEEVATNDVSGDTIVLYFRQDQVQEVDVRGGASGNYRFARIGDMLDRRARSRRLADLLADPEAAAGDSSLAADLDSLSFADLDSARLVEVDSLARDLGFHLPDRSAATEGMADSLLAAALDSLAVAGLDTARSILDFLATAEDVHYSGNALTFGMRERKIDIEGDGRLEYGSMVLTARHIKLDTDERELYADGDPLVEDAETIAGERMGYNFKHKTGAVTEGVTSFDQFYYVGDEIRRFEDTTLKIRGGRMTSCDLEEPHYHFWSNRMKMRMEDKVVAAPVVMHVGRVPIFALPFYYKSLKQGRQSGILFPNFEFGWSNREGRYIRDFGYYWATNEYMDIMFEVDYNERRDLGWRVQQVYNKRYAFNGSVNYSRKVSLGSNTKKKEWSLRANHNQPNLFDDYRFTAKIELASQTLSSNDLAGSIDRDVVSGRQATDISISRSWGWGNTSLTGNRREFTNAGDDDPKTDATLHTMTLPSLSVNFKDITVLPQRRGAGQGSFLGELGRNTYFKQSYRTKVDERGGEEIDTRRMDAAGNWSLTVRPPRLGFLNFSGGASAAQTWSRTDSTGRHWIEETETEEGYWEEIDSFVEKTTPSMRFNANANTTLYGLFPVQLGSLRAIRHTLRMSTGWSVQPALPGHQIHSSTFSFGLGNRFDVKYEGAGEDSTVTEKKLDGLIDWDLGTGYNPRAEPDVRWSDITSRLTIRPGQARYLQLKVTNRIDPYSLALKSTSFSYGLNFSGRLDVGEVAPPPETARNRNIERLGEPAEAEADTVLDEDAQILAEFDEEQGLQGSRPDTREDEYSRFNRGDMAKDTKDPTEGGRYIPFDMGTNLNYSYSNASEQKNATANFNLTTNLTRNWEFRYQVGLDLANDSIVRQQYSLNRNLHFWRLEFTRTISTLDSSFGFRLYLRAIPDLKFSRGVENYTASPGSFLP